MKRLGSRILSEFFGLERLENIVNVIDTSITESKLVHMLNLRYGSQILANNLIRNKLLSTLPIKYKNYIVYDEYNDNVNNERVLESELMNILWKRKSNETIRVLEIFGLQENYLPPEKIDLPDSETIIPEIQLFPFQQRVKDRFTRELIGGSNRILLHMPTGAGKTRTCIEGIIDYLRSVSDRTGYFVWLAHQEELCEQAIETFKYLWSKRGDSSIEIIRLWGDHNLPDIGKKSGFIVASLQKLHSMRTSRSNEVFKRVSKLKLKCKLIVIDEAHKAIAPTYKESIEYISIHDKTKVVGLTATPGRGFGDEETRELVKFFNNRKISITDINGNDVKDPIGYLQDEKYLARIIRSEEHTSELQSH